MASWLSLEANDGAERAPGHQRSDLLGSFTFHRWNRVLPGADGGPFHTSITPEAPTSTTTRAKRGDQPAFDSNLGGLVAAILFGVAQKLYLGLNVGVAKYDAVFGGLAVLPLLMVWMYFSWAITLLGAEVAYAHQTLALYRREVRGAPASPASTVTSVKVPSPSLRYNTSPPGAS